MITRKMLVNMAKQLNDAKVFDFVGIQDNVDPLSDRRSVVKCTNLEPHVKPGLFTLREPYQLKYKKPVDIYERINSEEFVSFDNFYEKTAREQAEVTVLISKGEVRAPLINGSRITDYVFNSVNIYVRPHWSGSGWFNSWMWLNEPIITRITSAPDATYKNKIQVYGYHGNMLQWTLINVTKDKTIPYAILRSAQNGSNTDLWISTFDPDIDVNDDIVLMRNYIPIKYLIQNYNVLREEISFHRVQSKMRIGFGGKEGRIALGIDYAKNIIKAAPYQFTDVDPLLDEFYFADCNRLIVQPYTLFNERDDFKLGIIIGTGTLAAGTYYFRLTGVLNDSDEVMVLQQQTTVEANKSFIAIPSIRAGALSRRLTNLKVYFSENGTDYYLWKEFPVVSFGDSISSQDWALNDDGYFTYLSAANALTPPAEINTESNATSAADTNALGSWTGSNAAVVAATNFAVQSTIGANGFPYPGLFFPINKFAEPLKPGRSYEVIVRHKGVTAFTQDQQVHIMLWKDDPAGNNDVYIDTNTIISLFTTFQTITFTLNVPETDENLSGFYLVFWAYGVDHNNSGDTYAIESLSIIEEDTVSINDVLLLGTEMSLELGYQATFNLVRDWMNAVYLNGRTYVSPAYIEKRYETYVFGSQINGDGANMYDVIPAGATVYPVDEYRGEIVTGMVVLHNLNIAIFTDGGLVILDPDTGNTREVARGFGLRCKGSIMVFRGRIIYGSDDDFIQISASEGYEAVPISSKSVREIYNNLTNKLLLTACFDRFGTYHVAIGEEAEYRELLLTTDRGWINQDREHYPQVFRNGLGGRVWFLNEGDIYAMPYSEEEFVGYADLYGDYRAGW